MSVRRKSTYLVVNRWGCGRLLSKYLISPFDAGFGCCANNFDLSGNTLIKLTPIPLKLVLVHSNFPQPEGAQGTG